MVWEDDVVIFVALMTKSMVMVSWNASVELCPGGLVHVRLGLVFVSVGSCGWKGMQVTS